MSEMRVKDFDDYAQPRRKPWLLLVILVVIAAVLMQRRRAGRVEGPPQEPEAAPQTEIVEGTGTPTEIPEDEPPPPADITALLAMAREQEAAGKLIESRVTYLAVLKAAGGNNVRAEAERRLGELNRILVLSPLPMPPFKVDHLVKTGDSVQKIANKYGTTVSLIQTNNPIIRNPHVISAGSVFRIFTGKFAVTVSKSRNDMILTMNDEFFKRYRVGTGKYDKTPVGTFRISEKIKEPPWWPQGREVPYGHPDNILGTHWMTLRATGDTPDVRGYGIHGTWSPESIGKSESAGCVRLKNNDVGELYAFLPIGTPVKIEE